MQDPIAFPNQNKTLKLVPLWEICVSLVDGPIVVAVPWNAPCCGAKAISKLWHLARSFIQKLICRHKIADFIFVSTQNSHLLWHGLFLYYAR